MTDFPILTLLVLMPAIGALLVAVVSNRQPDLVKITALLSSVLTGGLALWTLFAFDKGDAGFQFVSQHSWISTWGISWHLGVDGISIFLVVLTGILFPLVIAGIDPRMANLFTITTVLISIPIADFPGIGLRIRTSAEATA